MGSTIIYYHLLSSAHMSPDGLTLVLVRSWHNEAFPCICKKMAMLQEAAVIQWVVMGCDMFFSCYFWVNGLFIYMFDLHLWVKKSASPGKRRPSQYSGFSISVFDFSLFQKAAKAPGSHWLNGSTPRYIWYPIRYLCLWDCQVTVSWHFHHVLLTWNNIQDHRKVQLKLRVCAFGLFWEIFFGSRNFGHEWVVLSGSRVVSSEFVGPPLFGKGFFCLCAHAWT